MTPRARRWAAAAGLAFGAALSLTAACSEAPAPVPAAPPAGPEAAPEAAAGARVELPDGRAAQTACRGLSIVPSHRGAAEAEIAMQRARLRVTHPEAGVAIALLGPYYGGPDDDVPSNIPAIPTAPRPLAFVSDLSYERTEGAFTQELTVSWLGRLELEVAAPDCSPVRVTCDTTTCFTG